jgi:predicted O-methyltransferase YrrM
MMGNAFLHWVKCRLHLDTAQTQTSQRERDALRKYALQARSVTEIGVYEGLNTALFASLASVVTVYAIDPFIKGALGFSYRKSIAVALWNDKNIIDKINIIEGLSWDVIDQIPSGQDFIFIDGDHSFEGVKRDFELYSIKLSQNGILAFHDARIFDGGWTEKDWGPVRLMEEVIKPSGSWLILHEVDSLVIIQRK